MVADPHAGHVVADRLDDPGAFVAQHDRPVEREAADAVDDVQVAVTDAGRHGAHQHLAAERLVDVDRLDRQRFLHLAKYGGFDLHRAILRDWRQGFAERYATSSRPDAHQNAAFGTLNMLYPRFNQPEGGISDEQHFGPRIGSEILDAGTDRARGDGGCRPDGVRAAGATGVGRPLRRRAYEMPGKIVEHRRSGAAGAVDVRGIVSAPGGTADGVGQGRSARHRDQEGRRHFLAVANARIAARNRSTL